MNKDRIEDLEEEIDIYDIVDVFLEWKKIFFSIVIVVFIASIIVSYSQNRNKKDELRIEFHIDKERVLNDELYQKSGLMFPYLDLESISRYIKKSALQKEIPIIQNIKQYNYGSNIIEIRNIKKENNTIYFLESKDGEKLFAEKDKIFFEINKYISQKMEEMITGEEKKATGNIEYFSGEMLRSTDTVVKEELRKTIEIYLEQIRILTGLKLQKGYENMVVIDNISLNKKDNFLKILVVMNIFGIAAGIFAVMLCEFCKKYNQRKLKTEIK